MLPPIMTLFHGTSRLAANAILEHGMVPHPPERLHGDEDDPELVALPGTYFTNRLSVALRYAIRRSQEWLDEPVIISAQIHLERALPDEDVIRFALNEALQAEDGVSGLHRRLAGHMPRLIQQTHCLQQLIDSVETLDEGDDHTAYRKALDNVSRAYGSLAQAVHPHYLGGHEGHHTVRMPDGMRLGDLESITTFWLEDSETGRAAPKITNLQALHGKPILKSVLKKAVTENHKRFS